MRETVQPVSMRDDALALNLVENLPHLRGRVLLVIEKRNEARDGALEVDVVLPKRIVRVDQQRLRAVGIDLPRHPDFMIKAAAVDSRGGKRRGAREKISSPQRAPGFGRKSKSPVLPWA